MDYVKQQKAQIDEDAKEAKESVDAEALKERQDLADKEIIKVRWDAEQLVKQIQYDSKK